MPVAKMTRHNDTGNAREKLFFRRLGSLGEAVRFVLLPLLIDAFFFTAQADSHPSKPAPITGTLFLIHSWGATVSAIVLNDHHRLPFSLHVAVQSPPILTSFDFGIKSTECGRKNTDEAS